MALATQSKRPAAKSTDVEQTNEDFSENLSACVVQASREDRNVAPTGPGAVERVWIMSRPPRLGRGIEPTVTSRRAYVILTHIQGQMIDEGELVCKKVCAVSGGGGGGGAGGGKNGDEDKPAACSRGGNGNCD